MAPELEEIINRAIEFDPSKRFASAAAMAAALRGLVEERVPVKRPDRSTSTPDTPRLPPDSQDVSGLLEAPDRVITLYEMTSRRRDEGECEEIEDQLREMIRLDPGSVRARILLGRLCLVRRDFRGALKALDEAVSAAPRDPLPVSWRAGAALVDYQNRIGIMPFHEDEGRIVIEGWENETSQLTDLRQAAARDLRILERARGSDATPRQIHISGTLALYEGRYAEAADALLRVVGQPGSPPEVWLSLAMARIMQEDFSGGLEAVRRANGIRPGPLGLRLESLILWFMAYEIRYRGDVRDDLERATELINEATLLEPQDTRLFLTRSRVMVELAFERLRMGEGHRDELETAFRDLEELLRIRPGEPFARELLSHSLLRLCGDPGLAEQERVEGIQRAIQLSCGTLDTSPDSLQAHSNLVDAHMLAADIGDDDGPFTEALDAADLALALDPEVASVHLKRADILHRLRKREEARRSIEKAIALKPTLESSDQELVEAIRNGA